MTIKNDTKNASERIKWIDTAKGIAIMLVVFVHLSPVGTNVYNFLISFIMPLFFMLSGLFVLKNMNQSFREHFVSRFKRLMIPYFAFGLLIVIPYNWLYCHFIIPDGQISYLQRCLALFAGLHSDWGDEWRGLIWFIPCLFVADMMIWSIWKYAYRWRYLILSLLVISGIAYALTINMSLPMRTHTALIAVLYLFIGTILMDKLNKIPVYAIASFVICYVLLWAGNDFRGIVMVDNTYGLIYYSLPASILASVIIIYSMKYIPDMRLLTLFGEQTLAIYILHQLCTPLINATINRFNIHDSSIADIILTSVLAIILAYICAKAGQLIQVRCPWAFGMRRRCPQLAQTSVG